MMFSALLRGVCKRVCSQSAAFYCCSLQCFGFLTRRYFATPAAAAIAC
jgi:hypothetical protein